MTHDNTDEPKAAHPWAVLEGDTPLFHTPGTYPPLYEIEPQLEALWRARHGPKPYYEAGGITIYHGDCRDVLPRLKDQSIDVTITDPPYGIRKAGWDDVFPLFWLDDVARITKSAIAVMPGINNLYSLPKTIGRFEYRWMLSIHLTNGMTRGLMGFGNWIPVTVYAPHGASLYRQQQDATAVPISGNMPDHPSPKPLRAMKWLVSRFEGETILDPFMGSGSTLRAAKDLGRKAIGIEIDERYCEIAARRLQQEVMPLFAEEDA